MTLTLTLPIGERIYTGKQVTFVAPCDSEGLTGVIVNNIEYALVNAMGTTLVANSFDKGAIVSVIFNVNSKKAYVQNADTNAYLEVKFDSKADNADHNIKFYTSLEQIGITKGSESIKGIIRNIPNGSILKVSIGSGNADIYPLSRGVLTAECFYGTDKVNLRFTEEVYQKSSAREWVGDGLIRMEGSPLKEVLYWSGWKKIAVIDNYEAEIPVEWEENGTGFKQTISVEGMVATDKPTVGLIQTGTIDTDYTLRKEWNKVTRIDAGVGSIVVFCDREAPTVPLTIQIQCIR